MQRMNEPAQVDGSSFNERKDPSAEYIDEALWPVYVWAAITLITGSLVLLGVIGLVASWLL